MAAFMRVFRLLQWVCSARGVASIGRTPSLGVWGSFVFGFIYMYLLWRNVPFWRPWVMVRACTAWYMYDGNRMPG